MSKLRFLGLDVHADTIVAAVAEPGGEVRPLGIVPNRLEPIRKLVKKLGSPQNIRACYEAGPTGYVLYWQFAALGVKCDVIAPSLVPTKAGDRVKTDRRDAEKLARSHRSGDLTAVWVPDAEHEALRDLVRAREDAKQDQLRARQPPSCGMRPAASRHTGGDGRSTGSGQHGRSASASSNNGPKYVFLDEVERFVERGQTVVVYHHQTRERGGLAAQIQAYFVLPAVATAGS
jgi:hypothetical protein